jgi:class 3 adenylate cyclase
MESHSLPGKIQVTQATYERLKERYSFDKRGAIEVKGKGKMTTYFLTGRGTGE